MGTDGETKEEDSDNDALLEGLPNWVRSHCGKPVKESDSSVFEVQQMGTIAELSNEYLDDDMLQEGLPNWVRSHCGKPAKESDSSIFEIKKRWSPIE
jgi:alpha-D-ribose 1-methylphosphonate 5-triphosphate synthase subunit PhnH